MGCEQCGRIYLNSLRESASSGMSVMSSWGRDKQLSIIAGLLLTSQCLDPQSLGAHWAKNRCFTVRRVGKKNLKIILNFDSSVAFFQGSF